MNLESFTGSGSTPSRRRFWDQLTAAVNASQKIAGSNVTIDEYPGQGSVINVPDRCCSGGACCVGEDCSIQTEADCIAMGGTYQGTGIPCDPNPCVSGDCPYVSAAMRVTFSGIDMSCGCVVTGDESSVIATPINLDGDIDFFISGGAPWGGVNESINYTRDKYQDVICSDLQSSTIIVPFVNVWCPADGNGIYVYFFDQPGDPLSSQSLFYAKVDGLDIPTANAIGNCGDLFTPPDQDTIGAVFGSNYVIATGGTVTLTDIS